MMFQLPVPSLMPNAILIHVKMEGSAEVTRVPSPVCVHQSLLVLRAVKVCLQYNTDTHNIMIRLLLLVLYIQYTIGVDIFAILVVD